MGSFRSILWRSISTRCCAFRAAAMSWLVIEPKALSSAPTFRRTTTVLLLISSATAWASVRSFVSRLTAASRSRLASASAPFPAATASLRRSRKLRPYPSATSFTSPARPTFSTSFISKTRNSHDLRHGLIFVAVADSQTDSIDGAPQPVPRSSHGFAHITVPHALFRLQGGLMLGPDLCRASLDARLDREDAQGEHVELAQDRDPGREVERAEDQTDGREEHALRRGRNSVVPKEAVGKLAAPRHVDQNSFCPRKDGWHGAGQGYRFSVRTETRLTVAFQRGHHDGFAAGRRAGRGALRQPSPHRAQRLLVRQLLPLAALHLRDPPGPGRLAGPGQERPGRRHRLRRQHRGPVRAGDPAARGRGVGPPLDALRPAAAHHDRRLHPDAPG